MVPHGDQAAVAQPVGWSAAMAVPMECERVDHDGVAEDVHELAVAADGVGPAEVSVHGRSTSTRGPRMWTSTTVGIPGVIEGDLVPGEPSGLSIYPWEIHDWSIIAEAPPNRLRTKAR